MASNRQFRIDSVPEEESTSMKTTQSYLAGFEQETIHKTTDALTNFSKQKQA